MWTMRLPPTFFFESGVAVWVLEHLDQRQRAGAPKEASAGNPCRGSPAHPAVLARHCWGSANFMRSSRRPGFLLCDLLPQHQSREPSRGLVATA